MPRMGSIGIALALLIAIVVTPLLTRESPTEIPAARSLPTDDRQAPRRATPAGARFEPGVVPFVVNGDRAPTGGLEAVLAAADAWNALELGVELQYAGPTSLSGAAPDATNVVSWVDAADPTAGFVAITSSHWRAASPQVLTGFDMVFHLDKPFATDGRPDAWDVETVALHEFGHVIGLGHADADRIVQVMHPQLAPGDLNRSLTARDADLARSLYDVPLLLDVGLFAPGGVDGSDDASGGLFD